MHHRGLKATAAGIPDGRGERFSGSVRDTIDPKLGVVSFRSIVSKSRPDRVQNLHGRRHTVAYVSLRSAVSRYRYSLKRNRATDKPGPVFPSVSRSRDASLLFRGRRGIRVNDSGRGRLANLVREGRGTLGINSLRWHAGTDDQQTSWRVWILLSPTCTPLNRRCFLHRQQRSVVLSSINV
jgi:hypothetical protein